MMRGLLSLLLIALLSVTVTAQTDTASDIVDTMTLEHKVAQMFMVNLYGPGLTDAGREMLQTWQPGAVVLLDSNITTPESITELTNTYQQTITEVGGLPLFIATDQEGGIIARLKEGFTVWPVPMLLTATNDVDLAMRVGQAMGEELRAVGVNMNLAPVADLQTNINNPIIGRRSPGSDPQLVGQTIQALIEGLQSANVMATTKHFPGHGDTSEDSHVTLPELDFGRDRLDAVELPPFISAMDSGAMMISHIWFSQFDPASPLPSSLSYNIITGLLRDDLGYDGVIITDALDMDAIDTVYSPEEAAVMAVQAGNDLILIGANAGEDIQARAMQAVVDAVRSGVIDEARIDESVQRILEAKARFGVLDWTLLDPATTSQRLNLDAHALLVDDLFRAGVTLVQGDPIAEDTTVAIVYPANRSAIQRECSALRDDVRWYAVSDFPSEDEINAAGGLAVQVDRVVVFTRDAYTNTAQQRLISALPPEKTTVVALISPYDLLRFPAINGYMVTYSPLDPAISTACGILFGTLPARGTLSVDLTTN